MGRDEELRQLTQRVEKLERAVFAQARPAKGSKASTENADEYKGAPGGIKKLVADGFFSGRRAFGEVTDEMRKQGYFYSKQAAQNALVRLSRVGGPLVALNEKGKKLYAKRK